MLSLLLDIEWLLSTLFDASLLNLWAAGNGGSFFSAVPFRVIWGVPGFKRTPGDVGRCRQAAAFVVPRHRERSVLRRRGISQSIDVAAGTGPCPVVPHRVLGRALVGSLLVSCRWPAVLSGGKRVRPATMS